MIATITNGGCQRWRAGRDSYRPAGEPIDTRRYEVAAIPGDAVARAFVEAHHYSNSFPAARFRYGLYGPGGAIAGVAVFSQPVSDRSVTNVFPGPAIAGCELGRLVLLDAVPANGETWFIARCFDLLRKAGIEGVISCSDPMPRPRADGSVVMAGHVGVIYQAHNGVLLGRTDARVRVILPDGTEFNPRLKAKVRAAGRGDAVRSKGWRAAVGLFARFGDAGPEAAAGDVDRWLDGCLARYGRRYRHLGNHKYAWGLSRSHRAALPASRPFPKSPDPLTPAMPARAAA